MRETQEMAWRHGLDGAAVPNLTPSETRGMFERLAARRKRADGLFFGKARSREASMGWGSASFLPHSRRTAASEARSGPKRF